MEHADRSLPDPPPIQRGGRDLLRFAAAHLVFLGACFAIGETVFLLLRQSSVYEIGLGREFPTLEAAETALSVAIARAWVAIGVFSMLVVLVVWLRKRSFRWFWIPLAMVPYVGPLFFASPATWVLVNGNARRRRVAGADHVQEAGEAAPHRAPVG